MWYGIIFIYLVSCEECQMICVSFSLDNLHKLNGTLWQKPAEYIVYKLLFTSF